MFAQRGLVGILRTSSNFGAAPSSLPFIMRWLSSGLPTMRLILIVLMIVVAVLGALFGALNGDRVPIDFYFFRIDAPLGAALLAALLAGWLLGGLVAWIGHVPRLRRELRAARRELHATRSDAQTHERA
jgi:uncharacterized integral membrane protein